MRGFVDEHEKFDFLLSDEDMEGTCGVCFPQFRRPDHVPLHHPGYLCPACREHGRSPVGVVSFTPDIRLNILPEAVTTA